MIPPFRPNDDDDDDEEDDEEEEENDGTAAKSVSIANQFCDPTRTAEYRAVCADSKTCPTVTMIPTSGFKRGFPPPAVIAVPVAADDTDDNDDEAHLRA